MRRLSALVLALAVACTPEPAATSSPSAPSAAPASPSVAARPTPVLPAGFNTLAGDRVDVYAAPEISSDDMERVRSVADSVAPALERQYETIFSHRPTIYLFANEDEYRTGLMTIWHFSSDAAATTAKIVEGSAMPNVTLAIDWALAKPHNQLFVIPHELTHLLIAEYDPGHLRVPAWLNEGLARLSELMLDGMEWRAMEIRYMAASMATTGTLFPLAGLVDTNFRNNRDVSEVAAAYSEAAQAADFVRSDVGAGGIPKVLREIAGGASFKVAYLDVTGRIHDDFEATFADRAAALAPRSGAVVSGDAPDGRGPFLIAYGFPVSSPFTITLTGAGRVWTANGTTSVYGTTESLLEVIPAGSYSVSVRSGGTVATTSARVSR